MVNVMSHTYLHVGVYQQAAITITSEKSYSLSQTRRETVGELLKSGSMSFSWELNLRISVEGFL